MLQSPASDASYGGRNARKAASRTTFLTCLLDQDSNLELPGQESVKLSLIHPNSSLKRPFRRASFTPLRHAWLASTMPLSGRFGAALYLACKACCGDWQRFSQGFELQRTVTCMKSGRTRAETGKHATPEGQDRSEVPRANGRPTGGTGVPRLLSRRSRNLRQGDVRSRRPAEEDRLVRHHRLLLRVGRQRPARVGVRLEARGVAAGDLADRRLAIGNGRRSG